MDKCRRGVETLMDKCPRSNWIETCRVCGSRESALYAIWSFWPPTNLSFVSLLLCCLPTSTRGSESCLLIVPTDPTWNQSRLCWFVPGIWSSWIIMRNKELAQGAGANQTQQSYVDLFFVDRKIAGGTKLWFRREEGGYHATYITTDNVASRYLSSPWVA